MIEQYFELVAIVESLTWEHWHGQSNPGNDINKFKTFVESTFKKEKMPEKMKTAVRAAMGRWVNRIEADASQIKATD